MLSSNAPATQSGRAPHPRDVVVTGAGILTALGTGWRANADGFREGRVALREVTAFDTSGQSVHRAGEADLPAALPPHRLTGKEVRRLDRGAIMLLHTAAEALDQAQLQPGPDTSAMPLVMATSAGAMACGEAFYRSAADKVSPRRQAERASCYLVANQMAALARAFLLNGPVTVLSNACASGANALGHAAHLLRTGRAERVLAGGFDALCQLVFAGFDSLKALSGTLPRPFDAGRDGLALGEGAALMVLETRLSAEARGAAVLASLAGYGMSTDIHHLTQPHPSGKAAVQSMSMACADAGVMPAEVDYLNSHGTGTPLNDPSECAAIAEWAGNAARTLPVSSTKGSIGHLLGGAGAVEAVVCLMAMRESFLPPTASLRTADAAVGFDLVTAPRSARVTAALTNSFGFGGSNASLVFRL
jgi:3-oxoacyl-[acyl-carrier-protein] synthase II